MSTHENSTESDATVTFERDLETLVLEAFASGARIEGTWEIRPRPTAVPDWTVDVRRRSATDDGEDDGFADD